MLFAYSLLENIFLSKNASKKNVIVNCLDDKNDLLWRSALKVKDAHNWNTLGNDNLDWSNVLNINEVTFGEGGQSDMNKFDRKGLFAAERIRWIIMERKHNVVDEIIPAFVGKSNKGCSTRLRTLTKTTTMKVAMSICMYRTIE